MSKLTVSNASNHLKLLLDFLDPLVDADEARTLDRLAPIMGDLPIDHVSLLVGFLVNLKFETLSSGLTYQGFTLTSKAFSLATLVESIDAWSLGGESDKSHFVTEYIRTINSLTSEDVVEASKISSFHRVDALNGVRINDMGEFRGLGEFLYWFGADQAYMHAVFCMPGLLRSLISAFPIRLVEPKSIETLITLSKDMERLSNQSSDKQEG